jgi:formamidopyrimidine-DNA glycosylase
MPELPEVETIKNGLSPHLMGKRFKSIQIFQPKLRWLISKNLPHELQGAKIRHIRRQGKYILIYTDNGTLMIHLGMSGSLTIHEPPISDRIKHDHVEFIIENFALRYNDPRRFGAMIWTKDDPLQHPLLCKLGPEPLSEDFNGNYLCKKSRATKKSIKKLIMDGHIVVGVGNIYACEALFQVGLHPDKASSEIPKNKIDNLVTQIKKTLSEAIKQGGTTLKDFKNTEGKPGYFSQSLLVYGRKGKLCQTCQTPIESMMIAQRNSFFCPQCQKL